MECVFQLINSTNGQRSPAMKVTRVELANKAAELPEIDKYLVLVLMDQVSGDWDYSTAPLFRLDNFVKEFKTNG